MPGIPHIYIFVNPFSKKAASCSRWLHVELSRRNKKFTIFNAAWPPSLEGCSEGWIVGGDGTLNYFLNKYSQPRIPIAIFSAGTGNDFFHHLYGYPGKHQHLEKVLNAPARPVDAGLCNNIIYINQAGFGFDGEVIRSMKTIRLFGDVLGYYLMVLKNIFLFREPVIKITMSTTVWERRLLLTFVSNASQAGGGFRVNPGADISDGRLDLIRCHSLPLLKRLTYMPVIRRGGHLGLSFIEHSQVKELRIESDREIAVQLDGELIWGSSFDCKVLPAYLRIKF